MIPILLRKIAISQVATMLVLIEPMSTSVFAADPLPLGIESFLREDEYPIPDRIIRCSGPNKIDIGIRQRVGLKMEPIYFTRDQLKTFLSDERHKEFLAITFEKDMVANLTKREIDVLRREFDMFAEPLKYKRVLILADGLEGFYLVEDSKESRPLRAYK